MSAIWSFILDNWRWLICAVAGVLSVIFTIVRRPKVVSSTLAYILEKLPSYIQFYECPGNGTEKFKKVFLAVISDICKHSGLSADKAIKLYGSTVSAAIENILSCPQKKGV